MRNKNIGNVIKLWIKRISISIALLIVILLLVLVLVDGTFLPKKYLNPWDRSYVQQFDDPRIQIIAHGLLAPNAHNRQSWKIKLKKENPLEFTLFVDSKRLLHVSDPLSRQITMSQGTFLENCSIGATKLGYKTHITLFPDGEFDTQGSPASMDKHPVARVIFEKATPKEHPLYDAITRATSKTKLVDEPITSDEIQTLLKLNNDPDITVLIFNKRNDVEKIKRMTIDGMAIDLKVSFKGSKEETNLFRFTEWQKNKFRDGLSFEAFGFPKVQQFFMQSLGSIITIKDETAIEMGFRGFKTTIASTPAYLMILSKGNSRMVQVKSGMLYSRLEHKGTTMGFSMQPAEQILQEYPEMKQLYQEVHHTYANSDQTIQMLAGMGRPVKKGLFRKLADQRATASCRILR